MYNLRSLFHTKLETSEETLKQNEQENLKSCTVAAGCFWAIESHFGGIKGILRTRVGYTGGTKENPIYMFTKGHTESVQMDYDPNIISFEEILKRFQSIHDVFKKETRAQYKSVIFYMDTDQKSKAVQWKKTLSEQKNKTVYTEIVPATLFTNAEDFHQKFRLRHSKFSKAFEKLSATDLTNSFNATKVNGFIDGSPNLKHFYECKDQLLQCLSTTQLEELETLLKRSEEEL